MIEVEFTLHDWTISPEQYSWNFDINDFPNDENDLYVNYTIYKCIFISDEKVSNIRELQNKILPENDIAQTIMMVLDEELLFKMCDKCQIIKYHNEYGEMPKDENSLKQLAENLDCKLSDDIADVMRQKAELTRTQWVFNNKES